MQRYPWEQGVCAQALYEYGRDDLWIPMAYDAVKRMGRDGRLAMIGGEPAVSDPASCEEVCIRAYEKTKDPFFKHGADRMLDYLLNAAPRTEDGIICHNNVSFEEGFSPYQLWVDGIYMVPPFLAAMGMVEEAFKDQLHPYLQNFLMILLENSLLRGFSACCRTYRESYNKDHGIEEATVTSAVALTEAQVKSLKSKLEAISGKTVILRQKVDSSVLGGLRVEIGGRLLDGTVMGRLADLRKKVSETVL